MKNLSQLIKSLKLNYVNSDITEKNFPDTGRRSKDIKLYKFDKSMTSEEVIKEAEKDGYEPANARELLEWAQKNWNGKDSVVALGQQFLDSDGDRSVLCLWSDAGDRGLSLRWFDDSWNSHGVFAFVRAKHDSKKLGKDIESLESRILALENFRIEVEKIINLPK